MRPKFRVLSAQVQNLPGDRMTATKPNIHPFTPAAGTEYADFLCSESLGYRTLNEILTEPLDAGPESFATAVPGYTPTPADDAGPDHSWTTSALEQPGFPLVLARLLAEVSAQVYENAIDPHTMPSYETVCFSYLHRTLKARHVRRFSYANAEAYGFVFERRAFIVFCGSNDLRADWVDNFKGVRRRFGFNGDGWLKPEEAPFVDDVHFGFCGHLNRLKTSIDIWVNGLPQEVDQVILAGHSLGGALAILMAHLLDMRGVNVSCVMNFGAPAVGGSDFASAYRLGDKTWRVASASDPVVNSASTKLGFVHVGQLVGVISSVDMSFHNADQVRALADAASTSLMSMGGTVNVALGLATKYLGPGLAKVVHDAPAHSMRNTYIRAIDFMFREATQHVPEDLMKRHDYYFGMRDFSRY